MHSISSTSQPKPSTPGQSINLGSWIMRLVSFIPGCMIVTTARNIVHRDGGHLPDRSAGRPTRTIYLVILFTVTLPCDPNGGFCIRNCDYIRKLYLFSYLCIRKDKGKKAELITYGLKPLWKETIKNGMADPTMAGTVTPPDLPVHIFFFFSTRLLLSQLDFK